jgi:hypothetical protein
LFLEPKLEVRNTMVAITGKAGSCRSLYYA